MRSGKAEQEFISVHRNSAKFDHACHHKPKPVLVQRHRIPCGKVQEIAVVRT